MQITTSQFFLKFCSLRSFLVCTANKNPGYKLSDFFSLTHFILYGETNKEYTEYVYNLDFYVHNYSASARADNEYSYFVGWILEVPGTTTFI
jgi:hypothetical protein